MDVENITNIIVSEDETVWNNSGYLFYSAHALFLIGLLYTKRLPGHTLVFRISFLFGFCILSFWGYTKHCHIEVYLWFIILAAADLMMLFTTMKHVYYRLQSPPSQYKSVYDILFQPLNVSVVEFMELVKHSDGVKKIDVNDIYVSEGERRAGDALSLLLTGRLTVSQKEANLYNIEVAQFLDSSQWEAAGRQDTKPFQVTIVADVESSFITWTREKLEKYLKTHKFMERILNILIGRDIAVKLYASKSTQSSISEKKEVKQTAKTEELDEGVGSFGSSIDSKKSENQPSISISNA